jgi:thiol-disulfide isomerase/thioredoxin
MSRLFRVLAATLAGVLLLSGCTGKDAVDQSAGGEFRFVSATSIGKTIAEKDRKTVGNVTGDLIGGTPYALASDKGKVVVINFWATWCGPCKTETPQFDSLYRQVKDQGVNFVGVDTKELSRDAANAFISDNHISYPILWDEPGKTALQLGHVPSMSLPFTVVIDKSQRVAAVYLGAVAPADLSPVLTALVAES